MAIELKCERVECPNQSMGICKTSELVSISKDGHCTHTPTIIEKKIKKTKLLDLVDQYREANSIDSNTWITLGELIDWLNGKEDA